MVHTDKRASMPILFIACKGLFQPFLETTQKDENKGRSCGRRHSVQCHHTDKSETPLRYTSFNLRKKNRDSIMMRP